MPDTAVNRRRGTTAQHSVFTGLIGETTYNTTEKRLVAHDGTTAGGIPHARLDDLSGYQPALGFTPENVANKSIDGTLSANSDVLYPSQKAVKTYADTKQAALGFTPENVANKSIDGTFAANSDTLYPSQKAAKTYVDTSVAAAIAGVATPPFLDTTPLVRGSGDITKLLRFEVDGFTTATTRVITPPNADITLAGINIAQSFAEDQTFSKRILLPDTTSSTVGGIYFNSARAVHNFGSQNIFVGVESGNLALTGANNAAFGYQALFSATTGGQNVALGMQALRSNLDGIDNIAVGFQALFSNTSGQRNIGIGLGAGDNITSGSNNIVIGFNIDSPTATNNNTLTLGNLLFGTGLDGVGTAISTGSLGVGVIAPLARFHVVPVANTIGLAVTGLSLTAANAQSLVDLAGTWNTSGTPTGVKLNITDTASNVASLLLDLQVGAASKFSVSKLGALGLADGVTQTFNPNGTNAGINVGANAADPSGLVNGDIWYQSAANELRARINGATVALGAAGASPPFTDTNALVKGSADPTKLMRFEVDGFTTGVTRVLTVPNEDFTIAGLEVNNVFTVTQAISTGIFLNADGSATFAATAGAPLTIDVDGQLSWGLISQLALDGSISIDSGTLFSASVTAGIVDIASGVIQADLAGVALSFFNAPPVIQQNVGPLTDNTTGSPVDTIADNADGIIYANDSIIIRDNFSSLAFKINEILTALTNYGLNV